MTPKSTQRTGKRYSERKMPKVVPKFKDTLKFTFTHQQLGTVSWSWKDQIKQFWEDWIPKDKDLVIHTKLSKADEQAVRDAFWESMEEEIRNTKDSLNTRARERRAKKKANANQGSHPAA
jgi:hypothetical protein